MFSIRIASSRLVAHSSRSRVSTLSSHFQLHKKTPLSYIRTMASIPSTQKGVIIDKTGGTEVLQYKTDLPVPALVEGQILVKNDYIGINFIDT